MVSQSWHGVVKLAVVTGVAYFLAGRLGLALRAEPGVAIFWPAAGIAVGALIALGPGARLPVAVPSWSHHRLQSLDRQERLAGCCFRL